MLIKNMWVICFVFIKLFAKNDAVTHWVVTESGRIQAYMESPYDMRKPYDLIALMEQEKRHEDINTLYNDLIVRKMAIEEKWSSLEGSSNLGNKITASDPDCVAAGKVFLEIDLYSNLATNGTDREGIKIDLTSENSNIKNYLVPDCLSYSNLDNDKNVPPIQSKSNIQISPDESLKDFMPVPLVQGYGHEIALGLKKNHSSWVHYNLAAIFWRIKGDGPKAIDCIKRAIHFVPEEYRDIPLHNLAAILHQARHSKEASIFLVNAIEANPKEPLHYLALGHVYAALGDYNRSVQNYDQYLQLKPDQEEVIANKHATLCYWKLETGLINFQESLQGILSDLHNYHSQQQQWLRLQERLMWEHSSYDVQIEGIHTPEPESPKKVQRCKQKTSENSKPIISCEFYNQGPDLDTLKVENLFSYVESEKQKLDDHITKPAQKYAKSLKKHKFANDKKNLGKTPPLLHQKYPTTMSTATNQYYDATGWPSKEECYQWDLPINEPDDLNLPVYLPPENKGYQINKILGEYIGLPKGKQHSLPWYPPVCEHPGADGDKYLPPSEKQALNIQLKNSALLKKHLMRFIDGDVTDEAEIGQRIIAAMEKKTAPRWVLATLASLYWRVRGNARRALDCLDLAFQIVPKEPTDVVLVSIGSLVYQLGFNEQALKFATLAFKINYVEPSTNFLLAQLHYTKNNPLLAMYYMKNVLRVDPDYYDGKAEKLLKTWACRVKLGGYNSAKYSTSEAVKGMCSRKEKTAFKGEGMLCSQNGENCKPAALQCYTATVNSVDTPLRKLDLSSCNSDGKGALGHTLISTLLNAEGSGDLEPDQSKLESVTDETSQSDHAFHMRLSLGERHPSHEQALLGDFFVSVTLSDDPERDNLLHVYDQYGTYSLSATGCNQLKITQELKYSTVWPSIASRSLDITPFLNNLDQSYDGLKPSCTYKVPKASDNTVDYLSFVVEKHSLPNAPDVDLAELLGLMASDRRSTVDELGGKIAAALKDNEKSWILNAAAAVYWRVVGNTEEAITCLRIAIAYVPEDMRDIPLLSLANLLNRVGFHGDALEIAHLALTYYNNYVLHHYTIGNIHIAMGDLEKSVSFFRAALALDSNFAPARWKLQAVLCSLLFDEATFQRNRSNKDE